MAVKNRADIPTTSSATSQYNSAPLFHNSNSTSAATTNGNCFIGQNHHLANEGTQSSDNALGPGGNTYHLFEQDLDSLPEHVREAQKLAMRGNQLFVQKQYTEAIQFFTDAIKRDPQEVRFFGNRALCYEALSDFDKALDDADTAISLQPSWPRGYYRKGCALEGMNRYEDAEKAFLLAVQYDTSNQFPEALNGRRRVAVRQLMRLGFSEQQSTGAILHYQTVKQAADSLLATRLLSSSALTEIFDSDDEEVLLNDRRWATRASSSRSHSTNSGGGKSSTPPIQDLKQNDPLVDPKNPLKWDTLWVGNLVPQTTEKMIHNMFTKFGKIRSAHMMLEKHCCFVSFVEWKSAGQAMKELQGKDVHGQKILIKYPDRALSSGAPSHKASFGTLVLRKAGAEQNGGPNTQQPGKAK